MGSHDANAVEINALNYGLIHEICHIFLPPSNNR